MPQAQSRTSLSLLASLALLITQRPLPGQTQDAPPPEPDLAGLQAELRAPRSLYNPEDPIRLRFLLINSSEQPLIIPTDQPPAGDGIMLPLSLILGSGQDRFLSVIYEDEEPQSVPPVAGSAPEGEHTLRLAPHGAVGAEVDLREHYQAVRYPGSYRVEWRPLNGRLGVTAVEFRVEPRKDAILVTDHGKITFVLDYQGAPKNVENFLELVRTGFYDGKTFHRVVPGFVIQGGCPKGDGTGIRPDGKLVPAEFRQVPVDAGTLLMARKASDPNSASCQFFIALARLPELDGQYSVIGQASDEASLRTLQKLAGVPCDRHDRPLSPLVIRSINLVDAEQTRTLRLEARPRPATPPSVTGASGPQTGQP